MLICKVTISYDRGIASNKAPDLSLEAEPDPNRADGKILRGIGTHYASAEAAKLAKECDQENARVRTALRSRFLYAPIPGTYIVSKLGEAREYLETLGIRPDVKAIAHEYDLTTPSEMASEEIQGWVERLQDQIAQVSLGKSPEPDADGLACLESLAGCPAMPAETARKLRELVAAGRLGSLGRIEIKRRLKTISVPLEGDILTPRRTALPDSPDVVPEFTVPFRRPALEMTA